MSREAVRTIHEGGYLLDDMFARYERLFREVVAAPTRRVRGPVVPPGSLRREGTFAAWLERVASDPLASARRVTRRLLAPRS